MNLKPAHKTPSKFRVYVKVLFLPEKLSGNYSKSLQSAVWNLSKHIRDKSATTGVHFVSVCVLCCYRCLYEMVFILQTPSLVQANALNALIMLKIIKYISTAIFVRNNNLTWEWKRITTEVDARRATQQWLHRYCQLRIVWHKQRKKWTQ